MSFATYFMNSIKSEKNKDLKQSPDPKPLRDRLKREAEQFKKEFAGELLKLVTSGFGLVSALALGLPIPTGLI